MSDPGIPAASKAGGAAAAPDGDDPTAGIDWTKLDFGEEAAAADNDAAAAAGDGGGATPVDLSTLSFGAAGGEEGGSPTADIFGSFSVGDDPFAASSPMAQIDFGFGDGGAFNGEVDGGDSGSGSGGGGGGAAASPGGGEDPALATGIQKRLALEAQLTELSLKLETLSGAANKNKRKKAVAKVKEIEAKLEELKKLHGDDVFGGFTFDPSAFDPTAPTGFDARHESLGPRAGGGDGDGDGDGEEDDGEVDDSLLKLPDEALEGEAAPSGHEEEEELFRCRSKMHRFFKEHRYGDDVRENIWFDLGRGDCLVLRHRATGVVRLVFRQELTQKVKSNFRLAGALASHNGPTRIVFSNALSRTPVEDEYANVGEDKVEVQNVSFRFRQPADADQLLALYAAENQDLPSSK